MSKSLSKNRTISPSEPNYWALGVTIRSYDFKETNGNDYLRDTANPLIMEVVP